MAEREAKAYHHDNRDHGKDAVVYPILSSHDCCRQEHQSNPQAACDVPLHDPENDMHVLAVGEPRQQPHAKVLQVVDHVLILLSDPQRLQLCSRNRVGHLRVARFLRLYPLSDVLHHLLRLERVPHKLDHDAQDAAEHRHCRKCHLDVPCDSRRLLLQHRDDRLPEADRVQHRKRDCGGGYRHELREEGRIHGEDTFVPHAVEELLVVDDVRQDGRYEELPAVGDPVNSQHGHEQEGLALPGDKEQRVCRHVEEVVQEPAAVLPDAAHQAEPEGPRQEGRDEVRRDGDPERHLRVDRPADLLGAIPFGLDHVAHVERQERQDAVEAERLKGPREEERPRSSVLKSPQDRPDERHLRLPPGVGPLLHNAHAVERRDEVVQREDGGGDAQCGSRPPRVHRIPVHLVAHCRDAAPPCASDGVPSPTNEVVRLGGAAAAGDAAVRDMEHEAGAVRSARREDLVEPAAVGGRDRLGDGATSRRASASGRRKLQRVPLCEASVDRTARDVDVDRLPIREHDAHEHGPKRRKQHPSKSEQLRQQKQTLAPLVAFSEL
mmetsp:Transcript_16677/g.39600  ORF Transcript_16677/g.39600 Transcript_16677/m.39600 type:complete len:550 (-) Transcript_16677:704-2353(-)